MTDEQMTNSVITTVPVVHMLTTVDNPYNPFTQWDEWYAFDNSKGYQTSEFLARIEKNSDELSDADQDVAHEQAIDEIIKQNVLGLYKKIAANS